MHPDIVAERLHIEIDSLRAQLRAKDNEIDELSAELTTLAQSFEQSQREEDEARSDAQELKRLNAELESQRDGMTDEVQLVRKEVEEGGDEVRILEVSLWHSREEVGAARAKEERTRIQLVRAHEEIAYLRRVLAADTDVDKLIAVLEVSMELDRCRRGSLPQDLELW